MLFYFIYRAGEKGRFSWDSFALLERLRAKNDISPLKVFDYLVSYFLCAYFDSAFIINVGCAIAFWELLSAITVLLFSSTGRSIDSSIYSSRYISP